MKLYFTTEFILKVKGTTCIISRDSTKIQEIDVAIPKDLLTAFETLPKDTELEIKVAPATLYHNSEMKMLKRENE